MSQSTVGASAEDDPTIYTAYELDFMLGLRPSEAGTITREQVGLRSAPRGGAGVRHRRGHLGSAGPRQGGALGRRAVAAR